MAQMVKCLPAMWETWVRSLGQEDLHNIITIKGELSVQFSRSVMSDCDPMDCSMAGFPVHHQLPEPAQTHVHRVAGLNYRLKIYIYIYLERERERVF